VDIGATVLARDLEMLRQQAPKNAPRHMLLRLYQAKADFLLVTGADVPLEQGTLYPLASATQELKLDTGAVQQYTLGFLLPMIRQRLAQPLQQERVQ